MWYSIWGTWTWTDSCSPSCSKWKWVKKAHGLLVSQPRKPFNIEGFFWGAVTVDPEVTPESVNAIHRGWFDDDPVKFACLAEIMSMRFEMPDEYWGWRGTMQLHTAKASYVAVLTHLLSHLTSQHNSIWAQLCKTKPWALCLAHQ